MNDGQTVQHTGVPAARAASARAAAASASSAVTVMNALSVIRARDSLSARLRQFDRGEIAILKTGRKLGQRCVVKDPSFDDFRHQVQPVLDGRRIFLESIALVDLGDDVRTQPLSRIEGVRHRHDAVGIGRRQLIDEIDDFRQLFDAFGVLLIAEFQPRQHRNVLDLIFVE